MSSFYKKMADSGNINNVKKKTRKEEPKYTQKYRSEWEPHGHDAK